MALEIVRRIRGNVHGTVDVSALEDRVIAHPHVQRLRRIRQLAFLSYVFPGATHTRFEHSLGVMQLAGVAWEKLRVNQGRLAAACARYRGFDETEKRGVNGLVHGLLAPTFDVCDSIFNSDYTLQTLRLAGLMHDLGHPPFSHSGERFMPPWTEVLRANRDASPYVIDYLQNRCDELSARGIDPATRPVRHEVYTLLQVDRVMADVYKHQPKQADEVAARDVLAVIVPEIGPEPGSPLDNHGVHRLCNELISGEIDVDRMDYLLRDSRECGVVYGIFDISRILDSLSLYHDPHDGGLHVAINLSGLAAFEDYLRARYSMYLQLYFHKTSVAAEAMMQELAGRLGGWTLPSKASDFAKQDEYSIHHALQAAADTAISSPADREPFDRTLDDLLINRRLWKRVYEVSTRPGENVDATLGRAEAIIRGSGARFSKVSSSNSLTRFRPRQEHEISRNYLRLIKKDEFQFPRVVPIEDFSGLIESNDKVQITRYYVEDDLDSHGRPIAQALKQKLMEELSQ